MLEKQIEASVKDWIKAGSFKPSYQKYDVYNNGKYITTFDVASETCSNENVSDYRDRYDSKSGVVVRGR